MEKRKKTVEEFLDKVSDLTFSKTAPYKYAKHINYGSEKYKKGVVKSLTWVSDLSAYYLTQIKKIKQEFLEQIDKKEKELKNLKDSELKKGIFDGFKMAKEIIEFIEKSNK
ncbi:hypothetical protein [Nitrosophilus kaiyonis]|uniref:hypothetical protein n=1 Tax=Nitrosophilus kaiyonis TaxID=2930200 RepID=UPI00248FF977|nr:hypothetical protein [Nitrosophilus kaiyonis]